MDVKTVYLINQVERQDVIIKEQQAEIERLRADYDALVKASLTSEFEYGKLLLQQQPEPPQDEFRKGFDEFVRSLGGNPDNTGETFTVATGDNAYSVAVGGAIKPEAPQESLKVQILKFLATCRAPKNYNAISKGITSKEPLLSDLVSLSKSGYTVKSANGHSITAAGRDYLATLEPKEDVVECQSCGSTISEEHQREYGLEDMCMDCAAKVANARADENRWMYPDR